MPDKSEWRRRWVEEDTPWVYPEANQEFLSSFDSLKSLLPKSPRTLVPLCGNSPVMRFLYNQGHHVVGVEYISDALEDLVAESFWDLHFEFGKREEDVAFSAKRIDLLTQDFFKFKARSPFDFCYDRGSLVAIEPSRRQEYAEILRNSLTSGGIIYLVLVNYQGEPDIPFPISLKEAYGLFPDFKLLNSRSRTNLEPAPRLQERGIQEVELTWATLKRR